MLLKDVVDSPLTVEGVEAAVMPTEFEFSPCTPWRLNVEEIE